MEKSNGIRLYLGKIRELATEAQQLAGLSSALELESQSPGANFNQAIGLFSDLLNSYADKLQQVCFEMYATKDTGLEKKEDTE